MVKIAHIADIHIRGLSRHDELKTVFSEFVKKVKQQKVNHIFVGGDIFHTKTQGISPEFIDFMHWWLKELVDTGAQIHLTLGNHDGVLTNLSRQDAISPIVQTFNNSNIHLYKMSGVYEIEPGYNLCVFSLFDEEGWKNVKPVPGAVNIAAFHGPVYGALTESDWVIEDDMKIDFFKDYDFVLLGDIHKKQYLDYREIELEIDESDLSLYPDAEIIS